jgi:transcriptional regulator with XRE-family HTH domain
MITWVTRERMAELAGFLERRITELRISEREAARRWGISQPTLNKILNNPDLVPDLRTLERLARGMGMALTKLIALCGFTLEELAAGDRALLGLSDEQIAWWLSLPPNRRAQLLDALRQLHPADEGRQ